MNVWPSDAETGEIARLAAPVVVLLAPIALSAWYRHKAMCLAGEARGRVWYGYRRFARFVLLSTLAIWWALWDLNSGSARGFSAMQKHPHLTFAAPVIASLFALQWLNYSTGRAVAELHWSAAALLRLAWWNVVQNVMPILMIAAGFEALFVGRIAGVAWIIGAATVHRIGMIFLRLAEGMRFNRLKSGELLNRALAMSKRMGIPVRFVYMVPAGKGHLTNAFAGSRSIGLTDALPQHLSRPQIDSAIAHELIHVKHKHARKKSLLLCAVFLGLMLVTFRLPAQMLRFRPALALVIVYVPMLLYYYASRRAERQADREAVLQTGDAETSIRALVKLYQASSVPRYGHFLSELFQTHPSLDKRVSAIAEAGGLPRAQLAKILEETGIVVPGSDHVALARS